MSDRLIGQRFGIKHAAGVTRYQVDRQHRDNGYYECVAIRGVEGTHHFIGSIQVFQRREIHEALGHRVYDTQCLHDENGWCRNEFCSRHGALSPEEA